MIEPNFQVLCLYGHISLKSPPAVGRPLCSAIEQGRHAWSAGRVQVFCAQPLPIGIDARQRHVAARFADVPDDGTRITL